MQPPFYPEETDAHQFSMTGVQTLPRLTKRTRLSGCKRDTRPRGATQALRDDSGAFTPHAKVEVNPYNDGT